MSGQDPPTEQASCLLVNVLRLPSPGSELAKLMTRKQMHVSYDIKPQCNLQDAIILHKITGIADLL
jgi:hypothetical protein